LSGFPPDLLRTQDNFNSSTNICAIAMDHNNSKDCSAHDFNMIVSSYTENIFSLWRYFNPEYKLGRIDSSSTVLAQKNVGV